MNKLYIATLILINGFAHGAFSQTSTEPVTRLEEIVVTEAAPRIELPLSVSVLELPMAETTVIRDAEDLTARVPNLYIAASSNRSFGNIYTIRGISNVIFFGNPSLGTYVDDVPLGDSYSMLAPLYDVDRMEIYRGPQPERFGLNGPAGILSIKTKKAGNEWHGSASASYGSYETQDHRLSLSGPLIKDQLTLNVSGLWSSSEGYIENTYLNRKTDDRQMYGGRAVLNWTPLPDLEITLGFEGTQVNDGTQRLTPLDGNMYQVSSDVPGSLNMRQHREWMKIAKEFETFKVLSVTNHNEWEMDPYEIDLDLTPASASLTGIFPGVLPIAPGRESVTNREQEGWSQEIRFESLPPKTTETTSKDGKKVVLPAEDVWQWNAGLFYQNKQTTGRDPRLFSIPTVIPGPFTIYSTFAQTVFYSQNEENVAGYGNATYSTGPWELYAGARVDYTRKSMDRVRKNGVSSVSGGGEYKEWTVAPAVGVTFDINPNAELFARSTLGFKPGGFNPYADNPSLARFDRETIWASELGIRGRAFDDRLHTTLTGFYNHFDNYQIERVFGGTQFLVVNADEARSYGLEFEIQWELMRGLTLQGAVGYNKTELTHYRDPITGQNYSGNNAPYIPNFTALVALNYAHDSGIRANVEYVAAGDVEYDDANADYYRQNAYGVLNARVGFERDSYGIYLFGRNLAEKEYYTFKNQFTQAGVAAEPRILGLMAMLKF